MGVGDSNIQCEAGARKTGPGDGLDVGGRGGKRQAGPPSFQPEHLGRYWLRDEASGGGKHTQLHSAPAKFKVPLSGGAQWPAKHRETSQGWRGFGSLPCLGGN